MMRGSAQVRPLAQSVRGRGDPAKGIFIAVACFLAILAVLWPPYLVLPLAGINFSATRLFLLLSLGLIAAVCVVSPPLVRAISSGIRRFWRFYAIFAVLVLWRLICDLSASDPIPSITLTLIETIGVFSIFLPIYISALNARSRRLVALVLSASALIALTLGAYEAITGANIGASLAERSAVSSQIARAMAITQIRDGAYRVKSVFSHPILLSQFAGLMIPMFLHWLLHSKRSTFKVIGGGGLVLAPYVILSTVARSGILIAILSTVLYFVTVTFARRRIGFGALIAAGCAGLLLVVAAGAAGEFVQSLLRGRTAVEASSATSRNQMIAKGLNAIQESPFLGYGHGQAANYAGLVGSNNFLTIDNYYLSNMLDFGVPGLILIVALFLEVTLILVGSVRSANGAEERSMLSAFTAMAAVLVGQYVINSWDNLIFLFIGLGVAMGAVAAPLRSSPVSDPRR